MSSSPSLVTVPSVSYHTTTKDLVMKRKKVNLQSLPGAWIDEEDDDEQEEEDDNTENEFVRTVSASPPRITTPITTSATAKDEDIELLKQTIANLRKEKQRLEETNDIVKKSIQIVARKRMIAQSNSGHKRNKKDKQSETEEEEDIYIVVPSDFMPTQEEMKAAGLEGWEWISAY
jgi:transposase-like protein